MAYFLYDYSTILGLFRLYSQEVLKFTKVFGLEVTTKIFYLNYALVIIASDNNVDDIHNQINTPLRWMGIEDTMVALTLSYQTAEL